MTGEKKTIVVFGASGFIGRALVTSSAVRDRYDVLEVLGPSGRAPGLSVDFRDAAALERFALPEGVTADGVLFLQGSNPQHGALSISGQQFLEMLSVNVVGPTVLLQRLRERLRDGAAIVFVSSIAAIKGSYDPSYAAAKAALSGLMSSLSAAYPQFRFNSVALGLVKDSPVFQSMTEEVRARHSSRMRGGQFVEAADAVRMIVELLENRSVHGATIAVDCGYRE